MLFDLQRRAVAIADRRFALDAPQRRLTMGTGRRTRELEGFQSAVEVDVSEAVFARRCVFDSRCRFARGDAPSLSFAVVDSINAGCRVAGARKPCA